MKWDGLELPQVNGASDLQDSAAFAGMLTVFRWPQKIDLTKYVVPDKNFKFVYVRHPLEIKYDFSRDQFICLSAGFFASGQIGNFYVNTDRITGKDILSPSVRGHIARCQGGKASFLQNTWFWAELAFSAKFKPLDELNQLFCMMMTADDKFIKWYCNANPKWREALSNYWYEGAGAWRNEKEFCLKMISTIENRIMKKEV